MFQGIKKLFGGKKEEGQILAPVAGQAVPLSEVPDPAFAQEILGKGVAILPSENEFKAPASGEVTVLFETGFLRLATNQSTCESKTSGHCSR